MSDHDPPGFSLSLTRQDYDVVGATLTDLRAMSALLGPRRGGRHHAAYTDWTLRWSYAARTISSGWTADAVRVAVAVTRSLPRWAPVRSAERGLPAAWARYLGALTVHEQGHVDIAAHAGRAVYAALLALPARPSREDLDADAREIVRSLTNRFREEERTYDRVTDHGATQGCL